MEWPKVLPQIAVPEPPLKAFVLQQPQEGSVRRRVLLGCPSGLYCANTEEVRDAASSSSGSAGLLELDEDYSSEEVFDTSILDAGRGKNARTSAIKATLRHKYKYPSVDYAFVRDRLLLFSLNVKEEAPSGKNSSKPSGSQVRQGKKSGRRSVHVECFCLRTSECLAGCIFRLDVDGRRLESRKDLRLKVLPGSEISPDSAGSLVPPGWNKPWLAILVALSGSDDWRGVAVEENDLKPLLGPAAVRLCGPFFRARKLAGGLPEEVLNRKRPDKCDNRTLVGSDDEDEVKISKDGILYLKRPVDECAGISNKGPVDRGADERLLQLSEAIEEVSSNRRHQEQCLHQVRLMMDLCKLGRSRHHYEGLLSIESALSVNSSGCGAKNTTIKVTVKNNSDSKVFQAPFWWLHVGRSYRGCKGPGHFSQGQENLWSALLVDLVPGNSEDPNQHRLEDVRPFPRSLRPSSSFLVELPVFPEENPNVKEQATLVDLEVRLVLRMGDRQGPLDTPALHKNRFDLIDLLMPPNESYSAPNLSRRWNDDLERKGATGESFREFLHRVNKCRPINNLFADETTKSKRSQSDPSFSLRLNRRLLVQQQPPRSKLEERFFSLLKPVGGEHSDKEVDINPDRLVSFPLLGSSLSVTSVFVAKRPTTVELTIGCPDQKLLWAFKKDFFQALLKDRTEDKGHHCLIPHKTLHSADQIRRWVVSIEGIDDGDDEANELLNQCYFEWRRRVFCDFMSE